MLAGSSGFVYYVSVAGVTGAGAATMDHVEEAVARLRRHTDLPLCIGFGIRTPEHAAEVAKRAEGAVVGSALIDKIAEAQKPAAGHRRRARPVPRAGRRGTRRAPLIAALA